MAPNEDTCECLRRMSLVMVKYLSNNSVVRGGRGAGGDAMQGVGGGGEH